MQPGSISQMLSDLKEGDQAALGKLHRRCWPDIVRRAAARLGRTLQDGDEEDIAQDALLEFHLSFQAGRIPRLENRHHFLAFLTTVVAHQAVNRVKRQLTERRGGGHVTSLTPLESLVADDKGAALREQLTRECYEHYVERLPPEWRQLAELSLANLTHDQIAAELGCVRRTVIRKLERLHDLWRQMAIECGDLDE